MENQTTTPEPTTGKVQYAGFWWRFLAYIIDELIISVIETILVIPFMVVFGISFASMADSGQDLEDMLPAALPFFGAMFILIIVSIALNWLYFAIMESSKQQGTVGKMVLKIKVTDMDGNQISFGRATGRFFGKIVSGLILMIG